MTTSRNTSKLKEAFEYYDSIRRMPLQRLRIHHEETFKGTKYYVHIPSEYHRSVMERRLFYWHSAKVNPIHVRGTSQCKLFNRMARKILDASWLDMNSSKYETTQKELQSFIYFSRQRISEMSYQEVDSFLAALGFHFDEGISLGIRKQCLYEYFHDKSHRLPSVWNKKGSLKRHPRRPRGIMNLYCLRDIILRHNDLTWDEFQHHFTDIMPTVTRHSFYNTRSKLRKEGYDIPMMAGGVKPANFQKREVVPPDPDIMDDFQ